MRIAVAGGTGTVGRYAAAALGRRGHEVVLLTRGHGVDAVTGVGLDAALDGVEAVVDCLNTVSLSRRVVDTFLSRTTTTLLGAEARAGVTHHLLLSIVGADRSALGYHRAKVAQEGLVRGQDAVPWTILRSTQFHEFAGQVADVASLGPVCAVPPMRVRPVAASEVGTRLADLAPDGPVGRVTDLGGPREESLVEMVRDLLRHRGSARRVVALPGLGAAARTAREGVLLPGPDATAGEQTYAAWLATQPG